MIQITIQRNTQADVYPTYIICHLLEAYQIRHGSRYHRKYREEQHIVPTAAD